MFAKAYKAPPREEYKGASMIVTTQAQTQTQTQTRLTYFSNIIN